MSSLSVSPSWMFLVLVNLVATAFMAGMIWTIHVVHYPLFSRVGDSTYVDYQAEHMRRISSLLAVPWGVEVLTAIALVALAPTARLRWAAVGGLVLVGTVLALTMFGAAPIHGKLLDGFQAGLHRRLLAWDLARAVTWTVRAIVVSLITWWSIGAQL